MTSVVGWVSNPCGTFSPAGRLSGGVRRRLHERLHDEESEFTRHFGLEAEFIHLKIYADLDEPVHVIGSLQGAPIREQSPMSRFAGQFEVSHGLNLVLVNAFEIPDGRASLKVHSHHIVSGLSVHF